MQTRVPLEYRFALDAVMPACASEGVRTLICNIPALDEEIGYHGLDDLGSDLGPLALWIEPLLDTWRADLGHLSSCLQTGGTLYVIASRPMSRLLPESRKAGSPPLGTRPLGMRTLRDALRDRGFRIAAIYGMHGPLAVGLNAVGRIANALGRPDLGDRLHFAARLRYCTRGALVNLSTVCLIEARMEDTGL